MSVVELTQFAKARLWPDCTIARLQCSRPTSRSLIATPKAGSRPASATLEVLMPRGPVTAYALLGASFQPDESSTVLQITACEDEGGVPLTESMAALPETPLVGLPGEFVQPVLEGAVLAGAEPGLRSSGELIFDRAAFGPIGSNGLLFRQLAASLTRMLLGEIDQWEDLLRHELNRD